MLSQCLSPDCSLALGILQCNKCTPFIHLKKKVESFRVLAYEQVAQNDEFLRVEVVLPCHC